MTPDFNLAVAKVKRADGTVCSNIGKPHSPTIRTDKDGNWEAYSNGSWNIVSPENITPPQQLPVVWLNDKNIVVCLSQPSAPRQRKGF